MKLLAQVPFEPESSYDVKIWGTDSTDRGFYIFPEKKSFLLVGITYDVKGQLVLTRLDKNLNVVSEKILKSNTYDFSFAGTPAGKGNFILSGFTANKTSGRDAWIVKVNSKMDTLWTTTFGGPLGDQSFETLATSDGNYLAVGQTESWGNGGIDALIIKVNSEGKVLWHKTVGGPQLDRSYSAIQLDNGDYVISGITNENYPGNSDIWLYRLTPEGELVWEKRYENPQGDIAHSLHKRKDNTFFTVGYLAENSHPFSDPLIIHFNESGEIIRKYSTTLNEDVKLINGYVTREGNFIGTGFSRKTLEAEWDLIFVKFNFESGKMEISKAKLSETDEECGYHAQPLDDKTAIIYGHTTAGNGENLLIKWRHTR